MSVSFQDPEESVMESKTSTTSQPLEEIIVMDSAAATTKAPPDTLTSINNATLINRTETTRKSKMRLKTYFQRCKEAFIGTQTTTTPTEENCPITHQSSTSWYLEENTHQQSLAASSETNNKTKSENTEETLITANNNKNNNQQPDVTENGKNHNNIKSKQIEIGHEKSDFCATLNNIKSNNGSSQNGNMNEQLMLVNGSSNNNEEIVETNADGHQVEVSKVIVISFVFIHTTFSLNDFSVKF